MNVDDAKVKINNLMSIIAMQLVLIGFTVNSVGVRVVGTVEDGNVVFPAIIFIGLTITTLVCIRELYSRLKKTGCNFS